MSFHRARISWTLRDGDFCRGRYSREHRWTFDCGISVPASPAPTSVPAPYSNASHVDPEEAFVASIASCHMLTFLHLAARAGVEIASYDDDAVGTMTPGPAGVPWVSRVELRPRLGFGPAGAPSADMLAGLHERAHAECYIANSVRTEIVVLPAGDEPSVGDARSTDAPG